MSLLLIAAMYVAAAAAAPKPLKESPDMPPTKPVIPAYVGNSPDAATLSRDGKWVFAADLIDLGGVCVSVFDAATGQRVRQLPFSNEHTVGIYTIRLSADGKVLVASGEHSIGNSIKQTLVIKVWDLPGFRERRMILEDIGPPRIFDLSSDGRFAGGGNADFGGVSGQLRVWNLTTGKTVIKQDKLADIAGCCLSPDGKSFVWFGKTSWHLLDVGTETEKATADYPPKFRQETGRISPDGKTLVSVGTKGMMFWNMATHTPRLATAFRNINHPPPVFPADGHTVLLPMDGKVVYLAIATGKPIGAVAVERPKYIPIGVSASGDGKLLLKASVDRIRLFDASKLDPPPPMPPPLDDKALAMGEIPEFDNGGAGPTKDPGKNGRTAPATAPATVAQGVGKSPQTPTTTPPPAVANPPKVGPGIRPPPPPPAGDPAMPLIGSWTAEESGMQESWTISRTNSDWKINCVYRKAGSEVGSAHGENTKFDAGVLTFIRVFDKKPAKTFSDNTTCTVQLKGDRLEYLSTTGSKSKRLTLTRAP
jgi:hypothetical protein